MVRTQRCSSSMQDRARPGHSLKHSGQLMHSVKVKPAPKSVTIAGRNLPVSPVLDALFMFMSERHLMHTRRMAGQPAPWTNDPILAAHSFTNVFRVYDRVTQFVLCRVVRAGDPALEESCFRVILFRMFNRIETWELLEAHFGTLTWQGFDIDAYEEVLLAEQERTAIYGAVYIIPSPKLGARTCASNQLRLIQMMMEEGLPRRLKKLHHLKDAHGLISMFPSMGDFTALQVLLDLNMLPHFKYSEDEWVALGPGSIQCIRKIFGPGVIGCEDEALRYLHSTQYTHFSRLCIAPDCLPRLCDARRPGVSMVDLEHALCECEKYSRTRFPDIVGKRKNASRPAFVAKTAPLTAELPAHWLQTAPRQRALTRPPPFETDDKGGVYEVSHIVAQKADNRRSRYLVRWVGYGPDDDTWQSEADLQEGAAEVLRDWQSMRASLQAKVEKFLAMGDTYQGPKNHR